MIEDRETIHARGLTSIDACLATVKCSESLKSVYRHLLVDAHLPFCINMNMMTIDDLPTASANFKAVGTVLVMVNAFYEFIRTTYPEDEWAKQSAALRVLLDAALNEGPLS